MRRQRHIWSIIALVCGIACMLPSGELHAQTIGLGAGLAVPNNKISQVSTDLVERGFSNLVEQASVGYYLEARVRFGDGTTPVGGIGYNRFLEARSEYSDGENRQVTLETAQSIVPVTLGMEIPVTDGSVAPFFSIEGSANYFYRTYEFPKGDVSIPFEIERSHDVRFGGVVGAGLNLDLGLLRGAVNTRFHAVNLIGRETDESLVLFAQLGAIVYLGGF